MQGSSTAGSLHASLRTRLARLMAARLGLLCGVLVVALVFLGVGREGAESAERGLYASLALGFAATLVFAGLLSRVRRLRRFGALQLGVDVGLVTALVYFSGGADSFFSFLYLPITLYAAMLFDRRGAYGSAAGASLGYGLALIAAEQHGIRELFSPIAQPAPLSAVWVVHTAALLLVALLSSALARELRMAGQALEESTTDLDRLRWLHDRTVESLTSGLLTADAEGCITSFNPEAERITGWSEAEVLGRDADAVLPGVRELVLQPAAADATARLRARAEFEDRHGTRRHIGLAGSVLRGAEQGADGYVVIFQDVSDVVEMERDLRRSERLAVAGQLAAAMAHEIRNPLAAISGSIEMLEREGAEPAAPSERRRLRGIVLREVERLDRLISDFLQYARPAPPRPAIVELSSLIPEVLDMFEAQRPEGVRLEAEAGAGLQVVVDPTQLRQLLWNLLLNAIQALEGEGSLRVRAEAVEPSQAAEAEDRNEETKGGQWVEITVADTGPGIPPEALERIFDPFFTTRRGGSGLGLATVHRVVESNGGVLRVESRVGEGTAFHVRLPGAEVGN